MDKMPKWADVVLIPLISLFLAALGAGAVLMATGHDPIAALGVMIEGGLGSSRAWGYTLYYATNFIFTGLAVAVAIHARLFNIGAEGQALLGGVGVAVACLQIPWPHWSLAVLGALVFAGLFGGLWAIVPAWLQAKRGSHIVITTIMFNFIAAALLNFLLVEVMKPDGRKRAIFFRGTTAYGADSAQADGSASWTFKATRRSYETVISYGPESYVIPDALVIGG